MFNVDLNQPPKVDVEESDERLFEAIFHSAMISCPAIKSGAPSVVDEINGILMKRNSSNRSIMSLKEISDTMLYNEKTTPFEHYLFMMIALTKNIHSRQGSREPILKEEIESAVEYSSKGTYLEISRMI